MAQKFVTTVTVEECEEINPQELLEQNSNDAIVDINGIGTRKRNKPIADKFVYTCEECNKHFSEKIAYASHLRIHTGEAKCKICKGVFKCRRYLLRHISNIHTEKRNKYECSICDKSFAFKAKLKNHERVHTGEKPRKCDVCGKSFSAQYSLKTHMLIHSDEKPYECAFCEYKCRDSSTLRKHHNSHIGIKKTYECEKCDKTFKAKGSLERHVARDHLSLDVKKHECKICKKKFSTVSLRTQHIRYVHKKEREGNCDICGKYLSNLGNLAMHLTTHTDVKPYKCCVDSCFKRFKTESDKRKHEIIHYPDRQHACDICKRKFARPHRLLIHMRVVHERKKCVECAHCGVLFYSKNYLRKHIRMKHSSKKARYECDNCDFYTNMKPSLIKHIKAYHNIMERTCKICKKEFKTISYLKVHYLREHTIRHKKRIAKRPEIVEPVKIKEEPIDIEEHDLEQYLNAAEVIHADDIAIPSQVIPKVTETSVAKNTSTNIPNVQTVTEKVFNEHHTNSVERDTKKSKTNIANVQTIPEKVFNEHYTDSVERDTKKSKTKIVNVQTKPEKVFNEHYTDSVERDTKKSKTNIANVQTIPEKEFNEHHTDSVERDTKKTDNITNERAVTKSKRELINDATRQLMQTMHRRNIDSIDKFRIEYNQRLQRRIEADEELKKVPKPAKEIRKMILNKNNTVNENTSEQNESDDGSEKETEDREERDEVIDSVATTKVEGVYNKIKFNTLQCYICFKLFETKEKLTSHCQEHFDICSKKLLKKCPLCPYVTALDLPRHILLKHKLKIKPSYGTLIKKTDQKYAIGVKQSTKYFKSSKEISEIEVIPSVNNLNRQAYLKIDKNNRDYKSKHILKSKLIKSGTEWIVSQEKLDIDFNEYFLPELNEKYFRKVTFNPKDDYVEKMIKLKLVAKRQGVKMLAPCDICDKMCRNIAALKAHRKSHVKRPRVRRKPKINERDAPQSKMIKTSKAGKKVETGNGTKDSQNILEFYKKNVGGTEAEFEQFVKIFKEIDKVKDDNMDVLVNSRKYGVSVPSRVRSARNVKVPNYREMLS